MAGEAGYECRVGGGRDIQQSQKTVNAYLKSRHSLPFGFARGYSSRLSQCWVNVGTMFQPLIQHCSCHESDCPVSYAHIALSDARSTPLQDVNI